MGGLRTLVALLLAFPNPGWAIDDQLAATFASCVGRFSAEMEHSWLLRDGRSEEHEFRRRQFLELLDAVAPSDRRDEAMVLRVDAKIAHAELLRRSAFLLDADESEWAGQRARREIQRCTSYLLES